MIRRLRGCSRGHSNYFVAPGFGRNARLEEIAELIDWAPLERLLAPLHTAETGRPPYASVGLFKGLLLPAAAERI